jgi:hypothetical protein
VNEYPVHNAGYRGGLQPENPEIVAAVKTAAQ